MFLFCRDYLNLLVEAGADVNVSYAVNWPTVPLFDITIAHCLLDYSRPLTTNGTSTPLLTAMYNSDTEVVRFLLKNGANVNLPDQNGVTPLMHAVKLVSAYLCFKIYDRHISSHYKLDAEINLEIIDNECQDLHVLKQ